MSESLTQKWLRQNVSPYSNRERVYADIDALLARFPTLRPKSDVYTYDDGRTQLLLCVHGLLPISFRQVSYNIPIAVWVTREYPARPPIAYVVPTNDMLVKPGKYVDVSGKCNLEYTQHWERKSESCNLTALLEAMQQQFSKEPPLYSKPKNPLPRDYPGRPAPPLPTQSPPIPSQSAPLHTARDGRPHLPPKPGSSSASAHLASEGVSYSASSLPQSFTPRPPPPPSHLPIDQRPPQYRNPPAPPASPPAPPTYPVPNRNPSWSPENPHPPPQAYGWSGPPPQSAPLQPPPHTQHSGSNPASPPPNVYQYYAQNPPPPPQLSSPQVIPQPPIPIPDLLDQDDTQFASTSQAVQSTAPPPPRPPNPELLRLHAQVHQKLTSELASLSQVIALDGERLRAHQTDLLSGEPAIRDEMARLEAVRDVCRNVAGRMRAVVDQGETNVAELRRKGDPEVDELVCSTSIVHNQLINLVAEDNAIEDTIYHLHRALNTGRIDLERFLRNTRVLAEEQFMKRALIEKIQVGMPMGMSMRSEPDGWWG